jgi:predicted MFS family arabinose efflux permease
MVGSEFATQDQENMSRMTEARVQRLYDAVTGDNHVRACRDIPESSCTDVPGNYLIQLFSSSLTKIGDQCVNPKVVLPWIFQAGGVPPALLGFLVPIREAFSMLPQLVAAAWIRTLPRRKGLWILGAALQGLAALGMSLAGVFLRGTLLGYVSLGLVFLFSLSRGLCSVTSKDVVGKTVPKGRRGGLSGMADGVSGLAAVGLGVAAAMGVFTGGNSGWVVWLPAGGASAWWIASLFYARIKEPAGKTEGGRNAAKLALGGWRLLVDDPMFARFMLCRVLLMSTALVSPYISTLVYQGADHPAAGLGGLMILSGAASSVSSVFWGRLSDRSSRLAMGLGGLLCAAACATGVGLIRLGVPHAGWWGAGIFLAVQIGYYGVRLGRKTYVLDLASPEDRATYVAVANTLTGLLLLVGGALGAGLAVLGTEVLVGGFAGMALAGSACCLTLRNVEV